MGTEGNERWGQFRNPGFAETDGALQKDTKLTERLRIQLRFEFFNLFNRDNPGANYVTNISALPTPVNNLANATALCLNPDCSMTRPITSFSQLRAPAGALGDFFGPGTTVGIPFAAQLGVKLSF